MSRHVDTGSTDQTIVFWAFDSSGAAVEVTTSDSVSYRVDNNGREGTAVSMTLVARSVAGTHRDNAITYKGDGKHEIDLPDAAVSSAGEVTLEVTKSGVASVYVEKLEVSAAGAASTQIAATRSDVATRLASSSYTAPDNAGISSAASAASSAASTASSIATKLGGITLLKNWLALIMGKAADTTTRAEVNATTAGATYNETTDSLEAQKDAGVSVTLTEENIDTIVLNLTAAGPGLYNVIRNDELTLRIGDEFEQAITGLGNIASRDDLVFTLKAAESDADTAAKIYLSENNGLTRLNGAAYATTANGTITVDDEVNGDITIRISSAATASLTKATRVDAVKVLQSGGNDRTPRVGRTQVLPVVVEARG